MPKLTLRELFAIVTIVALALGWWVDHWRLVKRDREEHERFYRVISELTAPRKPTWEQVYGPYPDEGPRGRRP
jgi:hypothetical protein